jgi:molybdate transport system substrate-binding protein
MAEPLQSANPGRVGIMSQRWLIPKFAHKTSVRLLTVGLVVGVSACMPRPQTLTVSAGAGLADAFAEIAGAFEAANPGLTVELNLASSGVLAQQIRQGAAVDVYASASETIMDDLEADGFLVTGTRQDIAEDRLVLIAPLESSVPSSLADLSDVPRVAIGELELVPVGMYAQQSLQTLGLWDQLEGKLVYGESVLQVLAWVETGEVSAGVVYAADAQASGRVRVVAELPPESHEPIRFPIAVVRGTHAPEMAEQFVAFVTGPEGQAILARHGFRSPGEAMR